MKLIKTASGKRSVKISESEWQSIGKTAGWMKDLKTTYKDEEDKCPKCGCSEHTISNATINECTKCKHQWNPNNEKNEVTATTYEIKAIKVAKWEGDPEIKQTGEWAGKSISELNKTLSNYKKKQENYKKKNDGKANKDYTKKLREINFAIRSKKKKDKWGKVK